MLKLKKGDAITITSATVATTPGEVVETIDAPFSGLPELPGAPDPASVAAILGEGAVNQVAYIAYLLYGEPVCFCALGDGRGNWRDLRGAALAIAQR